MQQIVERLSKGIDGWLEGADGAGTGLQNAEPRDSARDLLRLQSLIRFASLASTVYVIALPIYLRSLGASGLETGLSVAIGEFATAMARPLIGRAMDKNGRRTYLRLGLLLVFVGMVLFAMARPFTIGNPAHPILQTSALYAEVMVFVARMFHGFGMGTMLLASYTMTADLSAGTGKGSNFGSTEQAQFRGGLYGALVALPVLLVNGFNADNELTITPQVWSTAYGIYAAGALLSFFMSYRGLPETRSLALAQARSETQEQTNRINPQLYVLMSIVLFTSFSDGLKYYVLRYIQDHLTTNVVWIALSYIPAAIIWGTLPARMGLFADKYGRKPPISFGLTVSGLFSLIIPALAFIFPDRLMAILALTIFASIEAICYSAAVPAEQALVADMMGGAKRGTGFGLYTTAQTAGRALGPLIMGALYDYRPGAPFVANAVILIVGATLVWFALKDPGRPPKTT